MTNATNTNGIIAAATQNMAAAPAKSKSPANLMKGILGSDATKALLAETLKENAGAFAASVLDLYNTDKYLQQCAPQQVFGECLKAASLKLPVNKQLGFAYVVPYKGNAQFQIGYKGMIQLCMRTGAYKFINADVVYEGEFKSRDKLTGALDISGEATSDKIVGYFAYIETLNGFSKALYMTADQVRAHGKKFSKAYNSSSSPWQTDFDAMAKKTVLRNLLSHYGYMSVEMANALAAEDNISSADAIIANNDKSAVLDEDVIDITPTVSEDSNAVGSEEYPLA